MTHSELANKLNDYAENITITDGDTYRLIPKNTLETSLVEEDDFYAFNYEKKTDWSGDKYTHSTIIVCKTTEIQEAFGGESEKVFMLNDRRIK